MKTGWFFSISMVLVSTIVWTTARAANPPSMPAVFGKKLTLEQFQERPRLVLVLVIDQFRADYLTRFQKRFLPSRSGALGGFQYLMSKGAYFPFAEYEQLQNLTGPGHATILTGGYPVSHRIILNDWFDVQTGKTVNCVEDAESPLIGGGGEKDYGVSPRPLRSTTVGDELKLAGYKSRVVAIALKDRAAVLLGGHRADLALWFSEESNRWVSSRYYFPEGKLPGWVDTLNEKIHARKGKRLEWHPQGAETGLSETDKLASFEAVHGGKDANESPIGVDLTNEAALAAIREYKLGSGPAPDVLAVSYSTHDMLGHSVGPNSRLMEEMTVYEDRALAELFKTLERSVPGGMKNVLVVLTADHGVAPAPNFLRSVKIPTGAVGQKNLTERMNEALAKKFGDPGKPGWIANASTFNFYLNRTALDARKVAAADVESALKELLLKEPSTDSVFTRSEWLAGLRPPGRLKAQAEKGYVPGQNGDVVLIPKPYHIDNEKVPTHITGYAYDRVVPVVLAGPNVDPGVYAQPARVVDIAPTLSFLLGIIPPAQSEGRVLAEALGSAPRGQGAPTLPAGRARKR